MILSCQAVKVGWIIAVLVTMFVGLGGYYYITLRGAVEVHTRRSTRSSDDSDSDSALQHQQKQHTEENTNFEGRNEQSDSSVSSVEEEEEAEKKRSIKNKEIDDYLESFVIDELDPPPRSDPNFNVNEMFKAWAEIENENIKRFAF